MDDAIPGLIVAAPASGSGKTTVTLALLRALARAGRRVASLKVGPDYIDPAFHAAASGRPCLNADLWAMRPATLASVLDRAARDAELLVAEGVMGLFDGAADDSASTAELAARTGWPVLLVVDAGGMAASAGALVKGFAEYREDVRVAAVLFNRVGSEAHAGMLRRACAGLGVEVLGALPRRTDLTLPDRHLGLVQASEHPDLERFVDAAASWLAEHSDLAGILRLAAPGGLGAPPAAAPLAPPGQRVALARDAAFGFTYPHLVELWREAGAEITPFSPLADEAPRRDADAVLLPGGYPELHASRLAASRRFLDGLREAAGRGARVHGECGGFMVLGAGITDADGTAHAMAGLLPVETSFAAPRLTLGYREAELLADCALGPAGTRLRGHEFHFATRIDAVAHAPLMRCRDSRARDLGGSGAYAGPVSGAFFHAVDLAVDLDVGHHAHVADRRIGPSS